MFRRSLSRLVLPAFAAAQGPAVMLGRPMDRVLQIVLRSFIRHGTLRLTTARGTVLEFGDGTGEPVAVRFTTAAAERGGPARPGTCGRRSLHGRHAGDRARLDRRFPRARDVAGLRRQAAALGAACNGSLRYLWRRLAQFNPPTRARAQRRASLRSRRTALLAVPRRRPAIQLRLFRAPRAVARRRAARQEAPSRRQAAGQARRARARHRLAAGAGSGSISPRCAARRSPASRCREEQFALVARARRGERPRRPRRVPPAGLPRHRRSASTASSRSACSSMSASATTTPSSANAPSCSPTTA